MGKIQLCRIISAAILVIALCMCVQPVLAKNVTIEYRGSGGAYIGDTVVFNGYNTISNTTVLMLTGPGLPAGGVPLYDPSGAEGTGTPVPVNPDGSWRFGWYTSLIHNVDRLQTARYYITAVDLTDASKRATTTVMMKKPDFYVVASPNPVEMNAYLQLVGTAEQGTPSIRIQITDISGNVLHTYDTGASASGYFIYGFHVDMQPGTYYILLTSPTMKSTYKTLLTVSAPSENTTASGASPQPVSPGGVTPAPAPSSSGAPAPAASDGTAPASPAHTQAPAPAPSMPVSPLEAIAGLGIAIIVILCLFLIRKKNP